MSEQFLRQFHAAHAGATAKAFARTDSYRRLAALVAGCERVLDLACGDGPLLADLGTRGLGVDVSIDELVAARGGARVQARAQELPFADQAFDACVCHLAFMLFDDVERVVAGLARVIAPGGVFAAMIGGGPAEPARERDAFHRFLALAPMRGVALGDRRARTEGGWRELFAGWGDVAWERVELELGGTFEDAWTFLGASYQLDAADAPHVREALRAELGDDDIECRVVCWLATVRR